MYKLLLHKNLDEEKWREYGKTRQVLMIANELNRLVNLCDKKDKFVDARRECFERAFELADLTIACNKGNFLKEFLRWREVLGEYYLAENPNKKTLENFSRVLVSLDSAAHRMLN